MVLTPQMCGAAVNAEEGIGVSAALELHNSLTGHPPPDPPRLTRSATSTDVLTVFHLFAP